MSKSLYIFFEVFDEDNKSIWQQMGACFDTIEEEEPHKCITFKGCSDLTSNSLWANEQELPDLIICNENLGMLPGSLNALSAFKSHYHHVYCALHKGSNDKRSNKVKRACKKAVREVWGNKEVDTNEMHNGSDVLDQFRKHIVHGIQLADRDTYEAGLSLLRELITKEVNQGNEAHVKLALLHKTRHPSTLNKLDDQTLEEFFRKMKSLKSKQKKEAKYLISSLREPQLATSEKLAYHQKLRDLLFPLPH